MSYSSIKITKWGINIDLQGLIFVAAITALGFVINTMAFPIAPSLWVKFGGIVSNFVSVCNGPFWTAISFMASTAYIGIVVHGDIGGIIGVGIGALLGSTIDKYLPPLLSVIPTAIGTGAIMFTTNITISGYPIALATQILLKGIVVKAINYTLFTALIAIPGIYKYIPMYYDSWVVRYWLLKIEEDQETQST
ncbi:MAG: hypothetical protein ACTSUV_00910 [Candidatus Ranarchaeia archaeon]